MAFVRMLGHLLKDQELGPRIVPIVADEARTFGMANLFKQVGIYSSVGQRYAPEDIGSVLSYREAQDGQILEEGIFEAGAIASWTAAATSYSVHGLAMLPFYIYYSMFGFQRVGDQIWAAADQRSRGFLLGATSGRTTLGGEGLQHQDGTSHLLAATIPNCKAYDPAFAGELAVILDHGMREMLVQQKDVFYYITVMNENYPHPGLPQGAEEGILKGMYLFRPGAKHKHKVQLLGSGTILREVIAAAELLETDWDVSADVWSCTSFTELRRDGLDCERWSLLHPTEPPRVSWVAKCLARHAGPVVASSDYIKTFADQIRAFIPAGRAYRVLGTDGFGRSDTRAKLRDFFEVDRHWVALAALKALADQGDIQASVVAAAIKKYGIDPNKPNPVTV